jgi:hypothetical protein
MKFCDRKERKQKERKEKDRIEKERKENEIKERSSQVQVTRSRWRSCHSICHLSHQVRDEDW